MLYEALKLALSSIGRNRLRAGLTVLGIVIGVGAVIAMVTIGRGTTARVSADLSRLGSNLLFVRPGQFGPRRSSADARPFKTEDVEAMRAQLGGVRAVAPVAQSAVTAVHGTESRRTTAIGTDNAFLMTQDWRLAAGRQFLEPELRGGRMVCILGQTLREKLFGAANPLGGGIRVNKVACEVIALLEPKGQSSFGTDRDDTLLMPLRAFHRRIAGNTDLGTIYVSAEDGVDTAKVQADVERLLRERRGIHAGKEDDFTVRDMRQLVETMTATTGVLTGLLGAVAAVSLLVGGIGIMNIMLVSVTERTREIGIRLAIGALERQVLAQFLVEAVALSVLGGAVGILAGLALAGAAVHQLDVPFVVDPAVVVLAFAFSAAIGVVFGYFPARRAARLNPIDALRRE
jgi:putative ABC transport system permease protein